MEDFAKLFPSSNILNSPFGYIFTLKYSHTSKNGTYQSFDIELLVHHDDDRLSLFNLFKSHHDIKMVL